MRPQLKARPARAYLRGMSATEITCTTFPEAAAVIAELFPAVLARVIAICAVRKTQANM